jgi:3',5'-cyclic-nucleotide phosphodiesterase
MRTFPLALLAFLLVFSAQAAPAAPAFEARVLGASGGIDESDLTCVLLGRAGTGEAIALDAGTVYAGLVRAFGRRAGDVLKRNIHGYFLSHAHLDHVSGLAIVSPDDTPKPVHGLPATIDALRDHLFNGRLWPNFTNEGEKPIGKYTLVRMAPGAPVDVPAAGLQVTAFPLSHGGAAGSTAFLVTAGDAAAAALYLGDTGPDAVEGAGHLATLWDAVAPLVRDGALRAIFIEASYPDPRPDALLFGHLTPKWIDLELQALASRVAPDAPKTALRGLTLVVTHIKPRTEGKGDVRAEIRKQLAPVAARGVKVIVPNSGERLRF